jgi:F-type H+-transporting ATPase subunit gamma
VPSLKAIRTRIGSVKNTQKITRAMKLVAAARLRRAQEAIIAARPYAKQVEEVAQAVAARADADTEVHPLLEKRPLDRVEVIVLGADRGLAGAFNTNISRAVERFLDERGDDHKEIKFSVVGRKIRDYLKRRKRPMVLEKIGVASPNALETARELALAVTERYKERQIDGVFLVYNEFKSAISQQVQVTQLLPIVPQKLPPNAAGDYSYEPSRKDVLERLMPLYIESQIFRALLESIASEFGAKMSAMDNATKNASEIIGKLTLQYNRARQAAITKELLEIIGGAEALKG